MRQGNMRDITIDDVKRILRDKVEQTLKHIYHYHWDTNRFDDEEVLKRITETQKKEQELKDNLKKDYKGTLELEHVDDLKNEIRENGWFQRDTPEVSQTSFLRGENSDPELGFKFE